LTISIEPDSQHSVLHLGPRGEYICRVRLRETQSLVTLRGDGARVYAACAERSDKGAREAAEIQ
jgi:hypothetical protein